MDQLVSVGHANLHPTPGVRRAAGPKSSRQPVASRECRLLADSGLSRGLAKWLQPLQSGQLDLGKVVTISGFDHTTPLFDLMSDALHQLFGEAS